MILNVIGYHRCFKSAHEISARLGLPCFTVQYVIVKWKHATTIIVEPRFGSPCCLVEMDNGALKSVVKADYVELHGISRCNWIPQHHNENSPRN
ncbi:hypothetical protein NPIL_379961 [Nephila pilipes]|uniref:Uncharacterized protein n=1 Tax=Nephila pilipes TaxID=299642 RepID=A0A8X6MRD2_NEPPI|nr:hypothetical protein NPIL_379961 [Nephila pilipes]